MVVGGVRMWKVYMVPSVFDGTNTLTRLKETLLCKICGHRDRERWNFTRGLRRSTEAHSAYDFRVELSLVSFGYELLMVFANTVPPRLYD
jgi:hypothetical protein